MATPKKSRPRPPQTEIVAGVLPDSRPPRAITAEFRELLQAGTRFLPVGEAKSDPELLLQRKYLPRHKVTLFNATFYLTDFRFEEGLNFLIAYIGLEKNGHLASLHPRIFYKDSTLVWRVASHHIRSEDDDWIGKGDVKWERENGDEVLVSDEDTTNLPYEIQQALDLISRSRKPTRDSNGVALVLRNAPSNRLHPYADFTAPRRQADREMPINGNRPIARIARRGDPKSLRFVAGFEPDFKKGILEEFESASRLYGGKTRKFRIMSRNGLVQYQFVASPTHVWLNPPQDLRSELTTFGLRALHVRADEDIFLPGYEYHFIDETVDPPVLHSQIPAGFAGDPSPVDSARADASRWINALPVVQEFRRKVLKRKRRK